jgi:hypothetical protein
MENCGRPARFPVFWPAFPIAGHDRTNSETCGTSLIFRIKLNHEGKKATAASRVVEGKNSRK